MRQRPTDELDAVLSQLRKQEEREACDETANSNALLAGWATVSPLLEDAIKQVNAILAKHRYGAITIGDPEFGPGMKSYGVEGGISGIGEGDLVVVLSEKSILYVNTARGSHWSEGFQIPLDGVTADWIAEDLAKVAKGLITE